MAADFLAWSYSRYKSFIECPRKLYHSVAPRGSPDRIEFHKSKAQLDGSAIDDALTARIGKGTPLPPQYAPYEAVCQVVIAAPGQKFTQMQLALDQSFAPCGTREWDTVWVRVAYDLAIVNGPVIDLIDWKNGGLWIDEDQLRLYAIVGFHQFPEIETARTHYAWLKHGTTSDRTYKRKELPDLWQTFIPGVERMQASFKANHWPTTPSKRVCKYCDANRTGKCKDAEGVYGG